MPLGLPGSLGPSVLTIFESLLSHWQLSEQLQNILLTLSGSLGHQLPPWNSHSARALSVNSSLVLLTQVSVKLTHLNFPLLRRVGMNEVFAYGLVE